MKGISLHEALIASRLAYGHVSVRVLPGLSRRRLAGVFPLRSMKWQKLPFRQGNLAILGSPMITALTNRPSEASSKLAVEGAPLSAASLPRFLEGVYTLHFGETAGRQPTKWPKHCRLPAVSGGEAGHHWATGTLQPCSAKPMASDAQVTLQDSVRAFKILADANANRHENCPHRGSANCLYQRFRLPSSKTWTSHSCKRRVANIQSAAYRVCLGTSTGIAHYLLCPPGQSTARDALAPSECGPSPRVAKLLESRRLRNRYPHLAVLNSESQQRFSF